jgi:hypothetical protein
MKMNKDFTELSKVEISVVADRKGDIGLLIQVDDKLTLEALAKILQEATEQITNEIGADAEAKH